MVNRSTRVLATLLHGEESYRVFADLLVSGELIQLRLHRFDDAEADSPMAGRKVLIAIGSSRVQPISRNVIGVSHILIEPVRLDAETSSALFGLQVRAAA